MPAAVRSDVTVFDPSEAALERQYLTTGSLGKINAYRNMQINSKNVDIARNNTAKQSEEICQLKTYVTVTICISLAQLTM